MKKIAVMILLPLIMITAQQQEYRAVWLTNVDSQVLETDESIAEAMDYLASIGINVVFPVVYNKGYTLYPSQVMMDYFGVEVIDDPGFKNRDFLERLVIEAHRNGIEVIPWFEYGFATSYSQSGGHIIAGYPDWALEKSDGSLVVKNGFDWMSAINPEAQDYMLALLMEVIDNYDVDGVQGDDRLPAMPSIGGYDSVTVAIYKSEHSGSEPPVNYSDASWKQWRADKLTQYFQRIKDSVNSRGDYLIVSSSPTPYPWGYNEYLQDSEEWVAQGILDQVIPQLYRYDLSSYQSTLSESITYIGSQDMNIYAAGILVKSGTYVISPSLLMSKLSTNRFNGVKGESHFFYEGLRANNNRLGDTLMKSYYSEPALLPYRGGNLFRPKAKIVNEDETDAVKTGAWTDFVMEGYTNGTIYSDDTTDYLSVEYYFEVSDAAYYDVFIYSVPNTIWDSEALYTTFSGTDSTTIIYDQTDLTLKGWQKIGTAYLEPGKQRVLRLDNTNLSSGEFLIADAAMIMINRKMSPNVIVSVDDKKDKAELPSGYILHQNYPNPFNPETKIKFELPESEMVKIKIYDILGREVTTLLSENRSAGVHEVSFNAAELSSGIYFYELNAGYYRQTKKMMLLK